MTDEMAASAEEAQVTQAAQEAQGTGELQETAAPAPQVDIEELYRQRVEALRAELEARLNQRLEQERLRREWQERLRDLEAKDPEEFKEEALSLLKRVAPTEPVAAATPPQPTPQGAPYLIITIQAQAAEMAKRYPELRGVPPEDEPRVQRIVLEAIEKGDVLGMQKQLLAYVEERRKRESERKRLEAEVQQKQQVAQTHKQAAQAVATPTPPVSQVYQENPYYRLAQHMVERLQEKTTRG